MAHIVGLLIMGNRVEPYLAAALHSLVGAVDELVVNDNSGEQRSANRSVLEGCELWRGGRVDVVEAPFVDFATARNHCLERLSRRDLPDDTWIVKIDADEVHPTGLREVTRNFLPLLRPGISIVDAYFLQFVQTMDYYVSLDRRHGLFFRYGPRLRYERGVHERLRGASGETVCIPYAFHHYGYVVEATHVLDRWSQYHALGDRAMSADHLARLKSRTDHGVLASNAVRCIPHRSPPPLALRLMPPSFDPDAMQAASRDFSARARRHLSHPLRFAWMLGRRANYRLRLLWRALEAGLACRSLAAWRSLIKMLAVP